MTFGDESTLHSPFLTRLLKNYRISFNITLAIVGVFAMIAAASPNFTALAIFAALWSVGVSLHFLGFASDS